MMPNHKGPPVASIISTTKKGDHDYGILKITDQSINNTKKTEETPTASTVLCTFQVPFHISIPEFLEFVAPVDSFVSHYRIIRDVTPDAYMVLMKFRDPYSANNYYRQYNHRQFSSMDPETCQVVYIESFEIDSISVSPFTFYQQYDNDDDDIVSNCPVCLEPMDESSTGLLTILCQHTFHCHCLSKWGDGSCPVCRYSQKPVAAMKPSQIIERSIGVENDENECSQCQSKENLWICLLCGHIGCGRYVQAHAYDHYTQTSHFYALEIVTQRVWDYAGDGYVHRLIQNAVDGKLVELPSTTEDSSNASQEKVEAMSLEYSYLLTSQLDSQRIYYENQMDQIAAQLSSLTADTKSLLAQADQSLNENKAIENENVLKEKQIQKLTKVKAKTENDLENWKEETQATKTALLKEKETTNSLMEANAMLVKNTDDKQKAIQELTDQVRDIKFFLDARETVQDHPELEGGSVETHIPQTRHTKRRGKRS